MQITQAKNKEKYYKSLFIMGIIIMGIIVYNKLFLWLPHGCPNVCSVIKSKDLEIFSKFEE